jgi:glycosyltransferase involved in cell wall biosynthesis
MWEAQTREPSVRERAYQRIDSLAIVHIVFTGSQLSGREVVVAGLARVQNTLPRTRASVVAVGPTASCVPLDACGRGIVSVVRGRGPSAWFRALRMLLRLRPATATTHVLHTHGLSALLLVCMLRLPLLSHWQGAAVVHTNHGFVETLFIRRFLLSFELLLYRFVDRIVVCSPEQAARLAAGSRPVDLVLNGVEVQRPFTTPQRAAARARLGLQDRFPVIGIVGRLAPEKRHDVFLAAGECIIRSYPDAVLLVAGDGPCRGKVRRIVRERNLTNRVWQMGHVANTADVYAALDLLLHTSDTEGTPLAVIEAMAAGVPVVATAVGGVPALVIDGVHGVLAPRRQPSLLAAAAVRVLADPVLRHTITQSARVHVNEQLSLERMSTQLDDVYTAAKGGRLL